VGFSPDFYLSTHACQTRPAGTVSPCGCSNPEREKGLGWIWRLPDSSVMQVMNTTRENGNAPQHPAPEHAPWQGNPGEDLEEENEEIFSHCKEGALSGGWTSSMASLSITFWGWVQGPRVVCDTVLQHLFLP